MKRKPDWQQQLHMTIEAAKGRPFSWGEHDCCLFAADVVKAIRGDDPMRVFRGRYDSKETALQILKSEGKGTLFRTLQSLFGQPVPIAQARRGDLVYANNREITPDVAILGPAVGVCLGRMSAFVGSLEDQAGAHLSDGIIPVPTLHCIKAFRI